MGYCLGFFWNPILLAVAAKSKPFCSANSRVLCVETKATFCDLFSQHGYLMVFDLENNGICFPTKVPNTNLLFLEQGPEILSLLEGMFNCRSEKLNMFGS